MSSSRDFLAATVADAALPLLRRPVEDLIYETLDTRQVPSRTDFKELRDLVNNLRGQLVGATGGLRRLVEQGEGIDERLAVLEEALDGAQAELRRIAGELGEAQPGAGVEELDERVLGLQGQVEGMVEQLDALCAADRGPGEAAIAELVAVRAELGRMATTASVEQLAAAVSAAQAERSTIVNELSSLTRQLEALGAAVGRLDQRLGAAPAPLSAAALDAQVEAALQRSIPAVLDRMIKRQVDAAFAAAQAAALVAPSPAVTAPTVVAGPVAGPTAAVAAKPVCLVEGCGTPARARGFCQRHYQHWKRNKLDGFPNPGEG